MKKSELFRLAQTFLNQGTDQPIEADIHRPGYGLCLCLRLLRATNNATVQQIEGMRRMLIEYYEPKRMRNGYWWRSLKHATQCQRFMALEFMALIAEEEGD